MMGLAATQGAAGHPAAGDLQSLELFVGYPISPSWLEMPRRDRILALAERLTHDIDLIGLAEVDGEFYWRVCRGDLLDGLSRLAASTAPHLLRGGTRTDRLDPRSQRLLDRYSEHVRIDPAYDEAAGQEQIARMRDALQQWAFERAARGILEQVPRFVWVHFAGGRAIPMRAPLRVGLAEGDSVLEIAVFSPKSSGQDLEALVAPPHGYVRHLIMQSFLPQVPFPPDDVPPVVDEPSGELAFMEIEIDEEDEDPTEHKGSADADESTEASLWVDFALVTEFPLPASLRLDVSRGELPFVMVRLPLSTPKGILALAYDGIVRGEKQWHLALPGDESNQEKRTAIWTWAIGLLAAEGEDFYDARWALEERIGLPPDNRPRGRSWFEKSRAKLVERVPEAEQHLYRRRRRSQP
jgi:hypothetical protein